jgi:uncharacterized RDD family membrane protein YckC
MNQPGQPPIADFMSRVVAWIIDGVILGIAGQIVWMIVFGIMPFSGIGILVQALAVAAISAGYFIYMWTTRKQTVGMMLMKLQVQKDGTGAALNQSEAIRRWLYLGLPLALATLISVGGGFSFALGGLGGLAILFTLATIAALVSIVWEIYLAYATNNDARKQGPHDKAAGSVVVAVGPSPLAGMGGQKQG